MSVSPEANEFSAGACARKQFRRGEVVVEDHIGPGEAFSTADGQQTWVTRPRADEVHFADGLGHTISHRTTVGCLTYVNPCNCAMIATC